MALGPVDVYIIGFPGNQFTGKIAPAVLELVANGTIRIIDVLLVIKDEKGVVSSVEMAELVEGRDPAFMQIEIAQPGALNQEDAEEISDDLDNNSSALLIAFENVWAGKLAAALGEADAYIIDHVRIPAEVADAVITN